MTDANDDGKARATGKNSKAGPDRPPLAEAGPAGNLDARRQWKQTIHDGQLLLTKTMIDAYHEYIARYFEAQRDLESLWLVAHKDYVSSLASASGRLTESDADACRDYHHLVAELSCQGSLHKRLEAAYRRLVAATTAAGDANGSTVEIASEYDAYLHEVKDIYALADRVRAQAEQAYSTLSAAHAEDCARQQKSLQAAYQGYADSLKDAYTRSDFERRTTEAMQSYLAAAHDAVKQSWTTSFDAAAAALKANKSTWQHEHEAAGR